MLKPWLNLNGTWRKSRIEDTIEKVKPLLSQVGITRVANVSGLDSLGLSVSVAIRPSAKNLSVAQGKGATPELAWVSAVMESIESWHAENLLTPTMEATFDEIHSQGGRALDPTDLFRTSFRPKDFKSRRMKWYEAGNVHSNKKVLLSEYSLSLDTSRLSPEYAFHEPSTNGLASGNDREEALCHALYELVERASVRAWKRLPLEERRRHRVKIETIEDPALLHLIFSILKGGSSLEIYDTSSSLMKVPVFVATIFPSPADSFWCSREYSGSGAHYDSRVALSRALTEAAQSRLSMISGAREDNFPETYFSDQIPSPMPSDAIAFASTVLNPEKQFPDLLEAIERVGCADIWVYDHSRNDFGIAVVQAVVPQLEALVSA